MTDFKIARALCAARRHTASPDTPLEECARQVTHTEMQSVLDAYVQILTDSLTPTQGYDLHPGVIEILDLFTARGTFIHALGTGNLERGARIKLMRHDLWNRFAFGGFGSDAEERVDILRAAWKRAEVHTQKTLKAADFVVIGDTPRDVSAAHELGIACVGVGTGRFSTAELSHNGADDALENLLVPDAAQRIASARHTA